MEKHFLGLFIALISLQMQAQMDEYCSEAKVYMSSYRFDHALESIDQCLSDRPENLDLLFARAQCLQNLGRTHDAVAAFKQVLEMDSLHIGALNRLAVLYSSINEGFLACETWHLLVYVDSTNGYYWYKLGDSYLAQRQVGRALSSYYKALGLNEQDSRSLGRLAYLLMEMKQYEKADSLLYAGLELEPENTSLLRHAIKSAYVQKDYPRAVKEAERYLTLSSDSSASILRMLGTALVKTDQNLRAIGVLSRAIEEAPRSEALHFYLGLALRGAGELDSSVVALEKSIAMSVPQSISTYYTQLALAYELTGDLAASIRAYQTAYDYSENELLLYRLARNYDRFYGDKSTALLYYETFVAQGDTSQSEYREYAEQRIRQLKEALHFSRVVKAER